MKRRLGVRELALAAGALLAALAVVCSLMLLPGSRRFGRVAERFPRWEQRRLVEAERLLGEGDRLHAVDRYKALVARHPDSSYLQTQLARSYQSIGMREEAARHFDRAHRLAPGDETIALDWIIALDESGKPDEALREAESLSASALSSSRALALRGTLMVKSGRPKEAIPMLRRAQAADPSSLPAVRGLGFAHAQLQEGTAAEGDFTRALAIAPCDLATLHAAADNALDLLDDEDRAIGYAQRAIDCPTVEAADKAEFFYMRAQLRLARDDVDGALDSLRSALEAGYEGEDWCEPGSPFVLALVGKPDFRDLLERCSREDADE